jgi:hypothetical protein
MLRMLGVVRDAEAPTRTLWEEAMARRRHVVCEMLVNTLVRCPYTQRGDIVLNLHPARLEVVNAGRLQWARSPHAAIIETESQSIASDAEVAHSRNPVRSW